MKVHQIRRELPGLYGPGHRDCLIVARRMVHEAFRAAGLNRQCHWKAMEEDCRFGDIKPARQDRGRSDQQSCSTGDVPWQADWARSNHRLEPGGIPRGHSGIEGPGVDCRLGRKGVRIRLLDSQNVHLARLALAEEVPHPPSRDFQQVACKIRSV